MGKDELVEAVRHLEDVFKTVIVTPPDNDGIRFLPDIFHPDDQLNEAIAVIKDFSASQGWPSVTTVIERDQTIRAHDVLTQLNRLLGSAARILPSHVHDALVTVNDDLEEWVVDLQSVTGSGYVGTYAMVLKHKFRKTDLDLLPEHFAGLL